MKISNKEKTMLIILAIIIIGFGYYNFVYLFQVGSVEQKSKQESEITEKYNSAMNTINSMEDKKSDVKILKAKINEASLPFYPIISEEHIILELDKLLKDNGLEGAITFQPIVSNSVENSKKEEKTLAESSLQGIVDQYNNKFKDTEKTQQSNDKTVNNTNTKANNTNGTSNTNNSKNTNENTKQDSKDKKKNTVQYLKCDVKFEGNYDSLNKFLNTISKNEKKIVVNSIKLSSSTLDKVSGTIDLEIYSVPKINDELESYLKWDLNNTYGKSGPFSGGTASTQSNAGSTTNTDVASTTENKTPSDFITSVKSINSDLPTIMMGKSNDKLRTTYVYADNNSEENAEMILTQDGDKYYYKYKTSKGTYPANYDGLGAEFVPASGNIVLTILSETRVTASDNSEIKLKIVNQTDKLLDVNISGDDSNNPRVTVDGDMSNISVNKK